MTEALVGQSFSGTVSTVDRKGHVSDLFNDPGVDGVAYGSQWGSVVYTHSELGILAPRRLRASSRRPSCGSVRRRVR